MSFPNSYKGIKKIRLSVILEIVASVLLLAGALYSLLLIEKGNEGIFLYGGAVMFFAAAGGLLAIVAVIFRLVGAQNAGKDAQPFQTAFIVSVVVLGFMLLVDGFAPESGTKTLLNYGTKVMSLVVTILIIKGIRQLAGHLNDEEMIEKSKRKTIWLIVLFILCMIGDIVYGRMTAKLSLPLNIVCAVIVSALGIAVSIVYLGILNEAVEMLEPAPAAPQEESTEA